MYLKHIKEIMFSHLLTQMAMGCYRVSDFDLTQHLFPIITASTAHLLIIDLYQLPRLRPSPKQMLSRRQLILFFMQKLMVGSAQQIITNLYWIQDLLYKFSP